MKASSMTRREFVRLGAVAAAGGAAVKATLLEPAALVAQEPAEGHKIRFVSIGTGIRGCDLLRSARTVPTGVCVGAADLYETRHQAAKEAWGGEIETTRDYRPFLDRKDVDAVLVATSDHLHRRVTLDAVAAGKDVYVEKSVTHAVEEGPEETQAVEKSGRMVQTGTQMRSWPHYIQGKQIVDSGALGTVRLVDAW